MKSLAIVIAVMLPSIAAFGQSQQNWPLSIGGMSDTYYVSGTGTNVTTLQGAQTGHAYRLIAINAGGFTIATGGTASARAQPFATGKVLPLWGVATVTCNGNTAGIGCYVQ